MGFGIKNFQLNLWELRVKFRVVMAKESLRTGIPVLQKVWLI